MLKPFCYFTTIVQAYIVKEQKFACIIKCKMYGLYSILKGKNFSKIVFE